MNGCFVVGLYAWQSYVGKVPVLEKPQPPPEADPSPDASDVPGTGDDKEGGYGAMSSEQLQEEEVPSTTSPD